MSFIKFNLPFLIKACFVSVCLGHILLCPFTKVEESFNLQAIHDILYYKFDVSKYDHNQFPGVVPRTFIGALVVALTSTPLIKLIEFFSDNMLLSQLVVRFVLGLYVVSGVFNFGSAIRKTFNSNVEKWTLILTMTQFHFVFYMSRTLPNIFALVLFLHAAAFWLKGKQLLFVWLSAAAILIFRFELCILSGIMLLISLANRKLSIGNLILNGVLALVIFIGTSILVDSYFWSYWLYPEGQVLWFNTILNKSSEWGTSPFLWYFYSAIPRALLFSLFLIPFAFFYDTKKVMLNLFIPSIGFVFIYSFLPHKELRFIIYVFPMLNATAAKGIENIRKYRLVGGLFKKIVLFAIYCHLIANLLISGCFLAVSKSNYPGGEAMIKLHELESKSTSVYLHIDVYSAQTGISRFLEFNRNSGWIYDKNESVLLNSTEILNYTHLFVEADNENDPRISMLNSTHITLTSISSYNGINYPKSARNLYVPVIKYAPKLYILKRNVK